MQKEVENKGDEDKKKEEKEEILVGLQVMID
jgi:hypothetical protein